jgi:hypothetical protein
LIDPGLIGGTPFNNRTAFTDLVGTVYLYHAALAQTIARTTGVAVTLYPLGDGKIGDPFYLDALTKQHASEANALGLIGPPSFSEFDLRDPSEFASFTFLLGNDLERLRKAAGLN